MSIAEIDLTGELPVQDPKPIHSRKRKADAISNSARSSRDGASSSRAIDLTGDDEETGELAQKTYKAKQKKKKPGKEENGGEKRLKR
jgi:hypothetical protein